MAAPTTSVDRGSVNCCNRPPSPVSFSRHPVGICQSRCRPAIISGSHDSTVRIWDPTTGKPVTWGVARIGLGSPVTGLTLIGPADLVVSADAGVSMEGNR